MVWLWTDLRNCGQTDVLAKFQKNMTGAFISINYWQIYIYKQIVRVFINIPHWYVSKQRL